MHPPPWDDLQLSSTTGILQKEHFVVYWCWRKTWDKVEKNAVMSIAMKVVVWHWSLLILGDPEADSWGEGESKQAEKYIWNEQTVPNGRRGSGFWLVPENLCLSGTNQKPERRRPFGTGLVRHCPQGLFSPFFTFIFFRATFFRSFRLSLVPTICPWVSEDEVWCIIWYVFWAVYIMLLPSQKPSSLYPYSLLCHFLVVHPFPRRILDPPLLLIFCQHQTIQRICKTAKFILCHILWSLDIPLILLSASPPSYVKHDSNIPLSTPL